MSAAEDLTGISNQQVSKWAKKLQKPEQYRTKLCGLADGGGRRRAGS